MQWTLTQLHAFVAVAEHGTMTAAARHLGYTTGAVSQHIAALQRATGAQLVAPRGRGIELTEEGRSLLPRAVSVLAAEAQAAEAVRGAAGSVAETVSVGVFGSASVVGFQPTMEKLAGTGINVRAREIDVELMQEAVLTGRIDVGIGIDYPASPLAPQRGVELLPVHEEQFEVVVACPESECEPPEFSHVKEDLAAGSWILPPNDSTFGRAVRFACADLGITPRESHIVIDSAMSLALAASGVGYTLATPLMMSLAPRDVFTVQGSRCGLRRIVVMTRTATRERPAVTRVTKALVDVFAEISATAGKAADC